jgi:hypothetical protein
MAEGEGIVPGLPERIGAERDYMLPRQGIGGSSPDLEHLAHLVHQLEAKFGLNIGLYLFSFSITSNGILQ